MNVFRSRSNVETSRREALEISNKTLKEGSGLIVLFFVLTSGNRILSDEPAENERLKKLHTESLNNFVDQVFFPFESFSS